MPSGKNHSTVHCIHLRLERRVSRHEGGEWCWRTHLLRVPSGLVLFVATHTFGHLLNSDPQVVASAFYLPVSEEWIFGNTLIPCLLVCIDDGSFKASQIIVVVIDTSRGGKIILFDELGRVPLAIALRNLFVALRAFDGTGLRRASRTSVFGDLIAAEMGWLVLKAYQRQVHVSETRINTDHVVHSWLRIIGWAIVLLRASRKDWISVDRQRYMNHLPACDLTRRKCILCFWGKSGSSITVGRQWTLPAHTCNPFFPHASRFRSAGARTISGPGAGVRTEPWSISDCVMHTASLRKKLSWRMPMKWLVSSSRNADELCVLRESGTSVHKQKCDDSRKGFGRFTPHRRAKSIDVSQCTLVDSAATTRYTLSTPWGFYKNLSLECFSSPEASVFEAGSGDVSSRWGSPDYAVDQRFFV